MEMIQHNTTKAGILQHEDYQHRASGHGWGRPDAAFWCCYGTGVEALARLQDGVFWRLEAGATVPGDDASSTTATDVVYIARVTTSAVAAWDEKGVTTRVSVDPFNVGGPVQRDGGRDGVRGLTRM